MWNALPVININLDTKVIKQQLLYPTSGIILNTILSLTMHVVTHYCVAAPGAINILPSLTNELIVTGFAKTRHNITRTKVQFIRSLT